MEKQLLLKDLSNIELAFLALEGKLISKDDNEIIKVEISRDLIWQEVINRSNIR